MKKYLLLSASAIVMSAFAPTTAHALICSGTGAQQVFAPNDGSEPTNIACGGGNVSNTGASTSGSFTRQNAIGYNARTSAQDATAIGTSTTNEAYGLVIGNYSTNQSSGFGSVVVGNGVVNSGATSVVVGYSSNGSTLNSGNSGIVLGVNGASNTAVEGVAIGSNADNTGAYGVAIGSKANNQGYAAMSLGEGANALATRAIAIGAQNLAGTLRTTARSQDSIAIGSYADANGLSSIAIGTAATATRNNQISFGATSNVATYTLRGLGNTQNTNQSGTTYMVTTDSAGELSYAALPTPGGNNCGTATQTGTNAVGCGNGADASGNNSSAYGAAAAASAEKSTALGSNSQATQSYATAVGRSAVASGLESTALGSGSEATQRYATAVGRNAVASGEEATALGYGAVASNSFATALGESSIASGSHAIAVGHSIASGRNAIAIGGNSTVHAEAIGERSIAFGVNANTASLATDALALGTNAQAVVINSVALGANSVTEAAHVGPYSLYGAQVAGESSAGGTVSVGSSGAERQIQNVAAGVISSISTDAVNGSQLFALGQNVNNAAEGAANGLGAGAAWSSTTGTWTAPSYQINGQNYNNVSGAVLAVNSSTDNLGTTTAARLGGGSAYVPGTGVTAPSYNIQGTTHNNVGDALGGVNNNLTAINNNVANLQSSMNNSVAGLQNGVNFLGANVNALGQQQRAQQGEYRQGIAIAVAMPTAHFPSAPGKTTVTVASGAFKGNGAVGAAVMHRLDAPIPLALGASVGAGFRNSVAGRAEIVSEF